ncbi:MAG: Ig-like domain-containing protein, partial [Sphaerochaeta sp.]|nr:Ig-like domain-containing protein [Sphaerochaeta sp.]
MRKSRKLTKYVMIVALMAIVTFMVGCPSETNEPVSVTDITITGAGDVVEVGNGNTLQMTADILPTGATDTSVTWSVVAGTGTATISTTGLLTAT